MRVHVVDQEAYATEIISDTLDYRYARRSGGAAELRATRLSSDTAQRCVALTRGLGLAFAGIDPSKSRPPEKFSASRSTRLRSLVLRGKHWPADRQRPCPVSC